MNDWKFFYESAQILLNYDRLIWDDNTFYLDFIKRHTGLAILPSQLDHIGNDWFLISMDAYNCYWTQAFHKYYTKHYFLARRASDKKDHYKCVDPFFGVVDFHVPCHFLHDTPHDIFSISHDRVPICIEQVRRDMKDKLISALNETSGIFIKIKLFIHGYIQLSNTAFVRKDYHEKEKSLFLKVGNMSSKWPALGIGAGARSSTNHVIYCQPHTVNQSGIKAAVDSSIDNTPQNRIYEGFEMSEDENKRRYIILMLTDGAIDKCEYESRFGSSISSDFPEKITVFQESQLVYETETQYLLTLKGFLYSDILSTLFVSSNINRSLIPVLIKNARSTRGQG